ncbi:MAG: ABC transporter permease, partial [Ktedonobacterales bacterium]
MLNLRKQWSRVKGQLAQAQEDEAFEEEIREHIALLENRYAAQGMSKRDAARAARRQFGNVTRLKERQRALRGILSPAEWWQDVRFGMRMLRKRPMSNAAVVLALALGIGMNAAVFTFVNALLLRPPQGVDATNKLIEIWLHNPRSSGAQGYLPFNYPDYAYYRDHARSVEGLLAFDGDGTDAIWNHGDVGEIMHGQLVSGNFFPLLRVNAVAGRTLAADDDKLEDPRQTVVVSYACWKEKLGGDFGIVGRTLMLDGAAFTVVGVTPPAFKGLLVGSEPDFWAPLAAQAQFSHSKGRITDRNEYWLLVGGRMRSTGDRKNAQAEMHLLARQVYQMHPGPDDFMDAMVYSLTLVPGPFRVYVGAFTGGLLVVFALVLLIACGNAASMLLARATGRVREMATRTALGAGRA